MKTSEFLDTLPQLIVKAHFTKTTEKDHAYRNPLNY